MNVHENAGLTPKGREILISRLERGEHPIDVATAMGVSAGTAHAGTTYKYLAKRNDCGSCPLKPKCTTGKARRLSRDVEEPIRDHVRDSEFEPGGEFVTHPVDDFELRAGNPIRRVVAALDRHQRVVSPVDHQCRYGQGLQLLGAAPSREDGCDLPRNTLRVVAAIVRGFDLPSQVGAVVWEAWAADHRSRIHPVFDDRFAVVGSLGL